MGRKLQARWIVGGLGRGREASRSPEASNKECLDEPQGSLVALADLLPFLWTILVPCTGILALPLWYADDVLAVDKILPMLQHNMIWGFLISSIRCQQTCQMCLLFLFPKFFCLSGSNGTFVQMQILGLLPWRCWGGWSPEIWLFYTPQTGKFGKHCVSLLRAPIISWH